jgi:AAA domain
MATIKNTRGLVDAESFRFVGLVYGLAGTGKTTWIGTCNPADTGIAACDLGTGSGLLPVSEKGFDYIEPTTLKDLEDFAKGKVFTNKKILVLDNLSTMARTIVKDAALAIPISGSATRAHGVPDLKDYGTIAEMIRRIIIVLINSNPDKHIIVTAHEKYDRPSESDPPGTESLVGPELAGQMFLAAPSMFDFVLRLRTRNVLKDPTNAKSKFSQRYFQTNQESGVIAKCRAQVGGRSALDREEVFDLSTDQGTFPNLLKKIKAAYLVPATV